MAGREEGGGRRDLRRGRRRGQRRAGVPRARERQGVAAQPAHAHILIDHVPCSECSSSSESEADYYFSRSRARLHASL